MHRLETPERLAELAPPETLARLCLGEDMTFADIGAGTGIFATAAAQITHARVWAVDPSSSMREIIQEKTKQLDLQQIELLSDVAELPKNSVDLAMLCTVLHEIETQEAFLTQIAKSLKPSGVLTVIEFHKQPSAYGPPPQIRIGPEDVLRLAAAAGFYESAQFTLGENYYCVCLKLANKQFE